MTDNGSEFRSRVFGSTIQGLNAEHRFIRAGLPQTNGGVEGVHLTILESAGSPLLPAT